MPDTPEEPELMAASRKIVRFASLRRDSTQWAGRLVEDLDRVTTLAFFQVH